MKRFLKILFLLVIGVFLVFPKNALAKNHGEAVNLQINNLPKNIIISEIINLDLYPEYTKIVQDLNITSLSEQKIEINLPSRLYQNESSTNNYLEELTCFFNGQKTEPLLELSNIGSVNVLNFKFNLELKNQSNDLIIGYKVKNRTEINGWRGFDYLFRGFQNYLINELEINLNLKNGLTPDNFQKNYRPDLDLKLEPINHTFTNNTYKWSFMDITPGFDLKVYFYWPNGDLINKPDLDAQYSISAQKKVLVASIASPKKEGFFARCQTNLNYLFYKIKNVFER